MLRAEDHEDPRARPATAGLTVARESGPSHLSHSSAESLAYGL